MKISFYTLALTLLVPFFVGCNESGIALKHEIQELKQGQENIHKELTDIKNSIASKSTESVSEMEIQSIKQGQEVINKNLEEIKKNLASRPAPPPPPSAVEKLDSSVMIGSIKPLGSDDAAVTLIEFSDYQCPFCARHATQTAPQIIKDFVETNKVRYVFRDFPIEAIHPQALKIAEGARCAGEQDKFWDMHDRLFANQRGLQPDNLPEHAEAIGLDLELFKDCLDSGKYAEAIRKDIEDGSKIGVRGTPSFALGISDNNQIKNAVIIRGAQPFNIFKEEIEKMLASIEK